MITITSKGWCSGCYACANICPTQCISMQADKEGFEYPKTDESLCIDCHLCERVCIGNQGGEGDLAAYAAKAKSDELRFNSSSGGMFTLLAEYILEQNGVVYGPALSNGTDLKHIRVGAKGELERLRGSKYIQSRVGNSYQRAKEDLDSGIMVLFTGTPCQIGGLNNFLMGKKYQNLLTQDIICHGVPPQKVWNKYLREKGFDTSKEMEVSFRHKGVSWASFYMRMLQGRRFYTRHFAKDSFGKAFRNDIMLRPSCYECQYKNMSYCSDITLGDFWSVKKVLPDFADEKGVSLVFINTQKGKGAFDEIKHGMYRERVDVERSMEDNLPGIMGTKPQINRELFFEQIDKRSFEWLVTNYIKGKPLIRAFKYIKRRIKARLKIS